VSEQAENQSTSRITRPLTENDIPPAQSPALTAKTSPRWRRLLAVVLNVIKLPVIWILKPICEMLKREANALEALSALLAMGAIVYGVLSYVGEEPQRRQASHNTAWQLINSATGQGASGGRIEALQGLNKGNVSLKGLAASNANLQEIKLSYADLQRADLSYADLQGAYLQHADLSYANLQEAFLWDAYLQYATLQQADLRHADLSYADLQYASLLDANLNGANLNGANLNGANLNGANLQNANLRDTNFTDADFAYADFRHSKNLTYNQVRLAKNWHLALFDTKLKEELELSP
jgi:uncharacterized protein YjbI with pentapeptide repeats